MPGQPYRLRGVERWVRSPSPTLGQHNHEVLAALGLTVDEIDALETSGAIGTSPVF